MVGPKLPPNQDPFLLKTLAVGLAGLLAVSLLAGLGGPPAYRWFKQKRFLGIARDHLEQRDYAGALFFTSQVLQQNPGNDDAVELILRILLEQNQPQAIFWAGKWAELDPKDPHRLLTLGKLSLGRGDLKTARTCLGLARKLKDFPVQEANELESGLRVREGRVTEALKLLEPAAQAPDAQPLQRLNYANLLLLSPQPEQQRAGITLLQKLAATPESGRAARRSLLLYALDHNDRDLARENAAAIQNAGLQASTDVFLWAGSSLLLDGKLPANFQEEAGKVADRNVLALPEITLWLLSRHLLDPATTLSRSRLDSKRHQPGVWALYAKCLETAGDWATLRALLPGQNWGGLDGQRLLHLMQAAALDTPAGPPDPRRNESLWFSLGIHLRKNPFTFFPLDRLAASWQWKEDRVRLWKLLDETSPMPQPFLKAELSQAQKRQDTIALYGLARQLLRHLPDDKALGNNTATYGLLLGEDIPENTELARTLVQAHPGDKLLKTTLALALLRGGKAEEALRELSDLSEAERARPDVAAYYAMVLAANGKTAEALPYKELSLKAPLLPEEKAMLAAAAPETEDGVSLRH